MSNYQKQSWITLSTSSATLLTTFNEYKEAVRDYIYIWRRLCEGRKAYTWEGVTDRVEVDIVVVEHYYNEQAPVDDAAVDVDYACG